MTFLTAHLPFPPPNPSLPPPCSHTIISDRLQSPAHFALYHLVAAAVASKNKVVHVDIRGEGRKSLETVLKKIGTPLSSSFIHIAPSSLPSYIPTDPPNCPRLFDDNNNPTLRQIYDAVLPHVAEGVMVILDGLSVLLDIGVPLVDITRLVRAVYSVARSFNAILVSTLHTPTLPLPSPAPYAPGPDIALLESLLRIGHGVWWRIDHLASGRSGDVMGELSSHPFGSPERTEGMPRVPRSKPLQYRLETATVRVFPKGTGRGFL